MIFIFLHEKHFFGQGVFRSKTRKKSFFLRLICIYLSILLYASRTSGLSLEGDLGEKLSLSWLTSPYFELREMFKCIEYIGKSKIWAKTSP